MKAYILFGFSLVFVIFIKVITAGSSAAIPKSDRGEVSFKEDVFPIIEEHCLPCHLREERNMSRLFMDDYESLMKGGFNGPPVKPGNAEESLLIKKISPNPPFGERMPMRTDRHLNDDEIDIITRWIEEGAPDN